MDSVLVGGLAFLGHVALGVGVINRVHGLGIPHRTQQYLDALWCTWQGGMPLAWYWHSVNAAHLPSTRNELVSGASIAYFVAGQAMLLWGALCWLRRTWVALSAGPLLSNEERKVDLQQRSMANGLPADTLTRWLGTLPGNQIFQLSVHEKRLRVPRLPADWEGLRMAHLSDLHMTGQLMEDFYHQIVDLTNRGEPDLIVITGDIVDRDRCVGWINSTLGRLRAPLGVWFILGNHDQRVADVGALRSTIEKAGLTHLGGQTAVLWRNGSPLLLAGNECPWFGAYPDLRDARQSDPKLWEAFTIGLSHSPDQIVWARRQRVDLLLAGHTHGGQVRFPVVGPVLTPSVYGVRFASGVFDCSPTVMHVSRGLSGTRPLRLWCAPELAFVTLTSVASDDRGADRL